MVIISRKNLYSFLSNRMIGVQIEMRNLYQKMIWLKVRRAITLVDDKKLQNKPLILSSDPNILPF
jgi:hypothetical protein